MLSSDGLLRLDFMQKFNYVRSAKLMEMYRTIPCQICGRIDGTVCGAHSNQQKHGKGRGIKASDIYCASLCSTCHFEIDFGKQDREFKRNAWDNAHEKTKIELQKKYGYEYEKFYNMA